ncbi:BCAS3 microtubule associated cell migration factor-like isoform X3 [Littorina saxatilis]|uniref:BCAS3 microtubule associated cell migration factor-like isoform X3 n=1 Tax=Littorina saxatilis TaxID=31220 RepID=UPI0038B5A11D
MAAESPRKGAKYSCCVVRPQPYSDKSVVDSVVNLISNVPQAYSSGPKQEEREKVLWVKFEECDVNDICSNPNLRGHEERGPPLLLVLGYGNGVQMWHITHQGEALEVLSLRQGPISYIRVLPTPTPDLDGFTGKRPLVAICDSSSAGQPFCGVKFVSLRSGDEVHSASFKTLQVHGIEVNKNYIAMIFLEKLAIFDACRLKQLCWIGGCFPCPGINPNPIALGTHWLAFADKKLVPVHQSGGGMSGDGSQSYAATVISAAKGAFKGLTMFSEAVVHSVTGTKPSQSPKKHELAPPDENGHRPGIVSVVDLKAITAATRDMWSVSDDPEIQGLLAHFHAHANEPVAAMAFDPSGMLLLTACKLGHNFHVFRLMTHPCSSSLGAVHHLYTLHRGDTTAKVTHVSFTRDSRWVSVSTHRGTTHIFPITPYGGTVNVRTHCQARVVNRISRFHKSTGLDDLEQGAAGRHSPVLSSSPGSAGPQDHYPSLIRQNALNNNMGNPRLPPFPHPSTVQPLAQIKSQDMIAGLGAGISGATTVRPKSPPNSTSAPDNVFSVAAVFSSPRLWVTTSNAERTASAGKKVTAEGLFVASQSGTLIQYLMEPRAKPVTSADKMSEDMPLDLGITGQLQWTLSRPKSSQDISLRQPSNSPLLQATDALLTQQLTPSADGAEPGPVMRYDSKDSLSSDHSCREDNPDEQWLSQVEIITHTGPHRRLWMGPQFSFKTYQNHTTVLQPSSPSLLSTSPESNIPSTMDILSDQCDLESLTLQPTRSSPVAMPVARPAYRRSSTSDHMPSPGRSAGTLLIEAGSFDQSPNLNDVMCGWAESNITRQPLGSEEEQDKLRNSLAEAMAETSAMGDCGPASTRLDVKASGEAKNFNVSSAGSSDEEFSISQYLTADLFHGSNDTLSTSSGSSSSHARACSDLNLDTVFPVSSGGSPDFLG